MNGSIPSWAVPGAKVVCVDASDGPEDASFGQTPVMVEGGIYTLSAVTREFGPTAVQVKELPAILTGLDGDEYETWMKLSRFRPLITKSLEQDSTMFRKLLQPKRVRGSVDA